MHIKGHSPKVKGHREAAQEVVDGGRGGFGGRVEDGPVKQVWLVGRDQLHEGEDAESGRVVLAAHCGEERGVAFSIAAAQLES